ncbi:MAG TPA: AraC family transcriptional regulator [Buttiauxella sp.]
MDTLHFVIFKQDNFVRFNQENIRVDANRIIVFRDTFNILMPGETVELVCTMAQLLEACDSLCEYLKDYSPCYDRNSLRILDFPVSAQEMLTFCLHSDRWQVMHYLIQYCLSRDWCYFSSMFFSILNEGGGIIGFMKEFAYNPWPVERYAAMLGISLRKFNLLFKTRFGLSPKNWLIETRLMRARYLLNFSSMPVADVAEHCGFSNHAYFSGSFRKRFACSPSQWRNKNLLNLTQPESQE